MKIFNKNIYLIIKSVYVIPRFKFQVLRFRKILFSITFVSFFLLLPLVSSASTLYFLPQSQNIYTGDTFLADVQIDSEQENINAIEGSVIFPENKLAVIDVIKGDSVVGLWVKEPDYNDKKGEISFSGGMPKGFRGQGSLFKINFKVLESGSVGSLAEVFIKDIARVLLNDGKATSARVRFLSGTYEIASQASGLSVISSSSHPDSNKWYKTDTLYIHWDLKKDAEYSYTLSKDPSLAADETPDRPEGDLEWMGDIKFLELSDGIYFFHLKEKPAQGVWFRDMVFRAMIDKTAPENLSAEIAEIEGKKYAVFSARDLSAGIDRYELIEADKGGYFSGLVEKEGAWKVAVNPYLLEDQSGKKNIKIKAIDKAGNEKMIEIISSPAKANYKTIILIIAAFAILLWVFFKKIRKLKHGKV